MPSKVCKQKMPQKKRKKKKNNRTRLCTSNIAFYKIYEKHVWRSTQIRLDFASIFFRRATNLFMDFVLDRIKPASFPGKLIICSSHIALSRHLLNIVTIIYLYSIIKIHLWYHKDPRIKGHNYIKMVSK